MVSAFVSSALLARLLSPEDFGAFFLVLTMARVAMLIGQAGMNQAVVRYAAAAIARGRPSQARDAVLKAVLVTAVGSVVVGLAYWLASLFWAERIFSSPVMAAGGGLVFSWIVAGSLRLVVAECFRGLNDLRLASLLELFLFESVFAAVVFLFRQMSGRAGFRTVLLIAAVVAVCSALVSLILVSRRIRRLPGGDGVRARAMLATGTPLLVSNISAALMAHSGLWLAGAMVSASGAALYGTALRLAMLMQLPILILNSVVPQHIAALHAGGDRGRLERLLRMSAAAEFIPVVLLYLLFILAGRAVLGLVFGAFYSGAYPALLLLCFGVMVNGWAGYCGPALMMSGNQKSHMLISLICGIIAVVSAILLADPFGVVGIAAAMAAANALQHFVMVALVKRRLGVWSFTGEYCALWEKVKGFGTEG